MATTIERRVLVLGSEGHPVDCYGWDNIPEPSGFPFSDYNTVIVNFTTLEGVALRPRSIPQFAKWGRLLLTEGCEVILIGHPETPVSGKHFLREWLPFFPIVISEVGTRLVMDDPEFAFYFKHVERWSWHASAPHGLATAERFDSHAAYDQFNGYLTPIAHADLGQAIAFRLHIELEQKGVLRTFAPTMKGATAAGGDIIALPAPTKLSGTAAVALILRTRYAAALRLEQEPEWVWSYQTSMERTLRRDLEKQRAALNDAEKQIASIESRLTVERRYAGLLHAKGDGPLASVIRDVLGLLGAVMTPHVETGADDGRFEDPFGHKYVLEAKGTNGATAKTHLRQLDEWVDTAVADKWPATGVLIINSSADKPLNERPEIAVGPSIEYATQHNLKIVAAAQLFQALCDLQAGTFDAQVFWNSIANANPVCAYPIPPAPPP